MTEHRKSRQTEDEIAATLMPAMGACMALPKTLRVVLIVGLAEQLACPEIEARLGPELTRLREAAAAVRAQLMGAAVAAEPT